MHKRTIRNIIQDQDLLTATADMPVAEAARQMQQRQVGAIVVVQDDRLVGIFTERDALFRVVAAGVDPTITPVAEVMTRNPAALDPGQPFAAALELMHEGQFRHVPIVENGRPVGMVSSRDALGPELEDFMYSIILNEHAHGDLLA
ncbi:MAG TPA: CBS domain-containing protein [Gammaproteobacteria bacterium]|nr:CBS domain-containing protein [Gammaproteobacteria bacterium]